MIRFTALVHSVCMCVCVCGGGVVVCVCARACNPCIMEISGRFASHLQFDSDKRWNAVLKEEIFEWTGYVFYRIILELPYLIFYRLKYNRSKNFFSQVPVLENIKVPQLGWAFLCFRQCDWGAANHTTLDLCAVLLQTPVWKKGYF